MAKIGRHRKHIKVKIHSTTTPSPKYFKPAIRSPLAKRTCPPESPLISSILPRSQDDVDNTDSLPSRSRAQSLASTPPMWALESGSTKMSSSVTSMSLPQMSSIDFDRDQYRLDDEKDEPNSLLPKLLSLEKVRSLGLGSFDEIKARALDSGYIPTEGSATTKDQNCARLQFSQQANGWTPRSHMLCSNFNTVSSICEPPTLKLASRVKSALSTNVNSSIKLPPPDISSNIHGIYPPTDTFTMPKAGSSQGKLTLSAVEDFKSNIAIKDFAPETPSLYEKCSYPAPPSSRLSDKLNNETNSVSSPPKTIFLDKRSLNDTPTSTHSESSLQEEHGHTTIHGKSCASALRTQFKLDDKSAMQYEPSSWATRTPHRANLAQVANTQPNAPWLTFMSSHKAARLPPASQFSSSSNSRNVHNSTPAFRILSESDDTKLAMSPALKLPQSSGWQLKRNFEDAFTDIEIADFVDSLHKRRRPLYTINQPLASPSSSETDRMISRTLRHATRMPTRRDHQLSEFAYCTPQKAENQHFELTTKTSPFPMLYSTSGR